MPLPYIPRDPEGNILVRAAISDAHSQSPLLILMPALSKAIVAAAAVAVANAYVVPAAPVRGAGASLRASAPCMDETLLENTLAGTLEEEGAENIFLSEVGWATYLDKNAKQSYNMNERVSQAYDGYFTADVFSNPADGSPLRSLCAACHRLAWPACEAARRAAGVGRRCPSAELELRRPPAARGAGAAPCARTREPKLGGGSPVLTRALLRTTAVLGDWLASMKKTLGDPLSTSARMHPPPRAAPRREPACAAACHNSAAPCVRPEPARSALPPSRRAARLLRRLPDDLERHRRRAQLRRGERG